MYIESEEQLRALYGYPKGRARDKLLHELEQHSIHFIERSPFMLVSTHGASGRADCSPRGGPPGFVKVISPGRLLIPDSKGNNRLDSLVNILETGHIGCLFLIPGVDETLRINGVARISTDASYLSRFAGERNPPKTCIELEVQEVFLHCAKALMRSELWSPESRVDRSSLPTMGQMLNDQLAITEATESQEAMVRRYQNDL